MHRAAAGTVGDLVPAGRAVGHHNHVFSGSTHCRQQAEFAHRTRDLQGLRLIAEGPGHPAAGRLDQFYRKLCTGKLAPVLETLVYLRHETDVWLEVTTLLIPGENDSPAELEALSGWIVEHLGTNVPLHLTAFHPDWKMRDKPPTPQATLRLARRIAREAGLKYVYLGNVHDSDGQSTYCADCGCRLIGRDWYEITDWQLTQDGRCRHCGSSCPGIFAEAPGTLGPRRKPVRLAEVPAR